MSLVNGFSKIKRSAGIKKCVLIDGNVGDVYLNEKNKIVDLKEYLHETLEELGYQNILYWDRVSGIVGDTTLIKTVNDVEVEGDDYSFEEEDEPQQEDTEKGMAASPSDIFAIVHKNIVNPKVKVAFVLNWAEYLFSHQGLSEEERQNITLLGKAIKDRPITYLDSDVNQSVVIIIANKASMMPLSFYNGNPEVELITLTKPDRDERKDLLNKIQLGMNIRLTPGCENILEDPKYPTYIDMLEDFTNREIIQLERLSNKEEKLPFDKLFYLFKYGEKDNPWEKLDYDRVRHIKEILSKRVVGQEEAIEKIEKTVIKAYMGLTGLHKKSSRSMPKGVFFFVGPTGVGKTELSKALAEFLFGDDQACIRFDMSEYAQENSDQKLIGAAPGYVGYEEGGQLTNAIKEHPFSVVLFDEIEKAAKPNPRILDIFLQILEDGRLTDSKGETVYFSDTVIIFTSNLGAGDVLSSGTKEEVAKRFIDIVKEYFDRELKRPELLGRIGYNNIVPFNFIKSEEFLIKIAKSKIATIQAGIFEKYKLYLEFENDLQAYKYILKKVDISKGGRDVLNAINDALLDPLAMFLFDNAKDLSFLKGAKIVASIDKDNLTFKFSND